MKALSIIEPWLALIIAGKKTAEFRTWKAPWIVGQDLLLCSSKTWDKNCAEVVQDLYLRRDEMQDAWQFRGHARCLVRVKAIDEATEALHGNQPVGGGFANYDDGKPTYAWELENVRKIDPFPVKGQLGIYEVAMPSMAKSRSDLCTVVNLRSDDYDVYIGRAGRGQDGYFGNPYRRGDVPDVLGAFRAYFLDKIDTDPEFRKRVLGLRGKRLGCFCKPRPCHGDIIAEWVNSHAGGQGGAAHPDQKPDPEEKP
jgi:hypothetical protein